MPVGGQLGGLLLLRKSRVELPSLRRSFGLHLLERLAESLLHLFGLGGERRQFFALGLHLEALQFAQIPFHGLDIHVLGQLVLPMPSRLRGRERGRGRASFTSWW
jgi:hypothetical protein